MVRVAIVGASGYAGRELALRCQRHGHIDSVTLMSGRVDAEPLALDALGHEVAVPLDLDGLGRDHDVVFTCLPHGLGSGVVEAALGARPETVVVDLSADHRFQDSALYERVYGVAHPTPALCDAARYGLTEFERQTLPGARLVANPGCYPTASLLAILPLVRAGLVAPKSRIVVDAKSGVSGAGKSPSEVTLYGNVNETCRAYGVGTHRHAPEIASRIGADHALTFVPHLLPMFRGMLATVYVEPSTGTDLGHAREALLGAYADEPFVHVIDAQPKTGDVSGTNHCHVAIAEADGAFVVTSAIDNLVKGAAGQALQNMNAVLGFDEQEGLVSESQRILVKVGGAILDDPAARAAFAKSVVGAVAAGQQVVVVHGGGQQVTRLTDALGLVPRRVRGLRVTDDATAAAVLQVLGGEVNAQLVAALEAAGEALGVHALGVTGADGGLMSAAIADPDLGHVGEVTSVRAEVLERLVGAGFVPVVATVVPGPSAGGPFLNVNADAAVAPLAAAWNADAVLFLSDVAHVRGPGGRIASIDHGHAAALERDGTIAGGMIPKVLAALDAVAALPSATVKIASGSPDSGDAIGHAMRPDAGTLFAARRDSTPAEAHHG